MVHPVRGAPRISVLTPTYQRAHTLPRAYESLRAQTYRDFEWVVVDDGSSDGTGALVAGWAAEADFPVRYVAQPNAGKHAALNRGVAEVQGELTGVLDSDDWYVPEALERLVHHWDAIPEAEREGFANVEGRSQDTEGRRLGPPLPRQVFDSDNFELRVTLGIGGDSVGLYRTDVLRDHPFPEDLGRFVTEAIVWYRIAARYRARFVDEVLLVKEYQPGGLSDRLGATRALVEASPSLLVYHRELLGYDRPMPRGERVRSYANVVRHALHAGRDPRVELRGTPSRSLRLVALPLGVALYRRDRHRLRG